MKKEEINFILKKQKEANLHLDMYLKLDKEIMELCLKNMPKQIAECNSEKELDELVMFINTFYADAFALPGYKNCHFFIYKRRYELENKQDR